MKKGGSPFTDSWFEMPFWILFFLLVVICILLWQFGIFNIKKTIPLLKPQVVLQPILELIDTNYNYISNSVHIEYRSQGCEGCKVLLRPMYQDGILHEFKEFPIGNNKVDLKLYKRPSSLTIQGYIQYNGTSTTSIQEREVMVPQNSK